MRNKLRMLAGAAGVLILVAVAVFVICQSRKLGKETIQEVPGKEKVVLLTKSTNSSFWQSVYDGADVAASEYNLELEFKGPDNEEDYMTQNRMIEEAVKEGADVILLSAIDYDANAEYVEWAAKKGVRIISIDSEVNSDAVEGYVGTDSYEAGCMAARALLKDQPEDSLYIGIVNFDQNTRNGQKREEGFRDTIRESGAGSVIESIHVRSSTVEAKEQTVDMINRHPDLNAVVTFNEWTSLGVGYAIQELGKGETIRAVAFDSNIVSVGMLESGDVDALIVQNPYAMGYLAVERAYELLSGKKPKEAVTTTESFAVTKENMYEEEYQRILFTFDK